MIFKCPVCNKIKKHGEWLEWESFEPETREFYGKYVKLIPVPCPKHEDRTTDSKKHKPA